MIKIHKTGKSRRTIVSLLDATIASVFLQLESNIANSVPFLRQKLRLDQRSMTVESMAKMIQ